MSKSRVCAANLGNEVGHLRSLAIPEIEIKFILKITISEVGGGVQSLLQVQLCSNLKWEKFLIPS